MSVLMEFAIFPTDKGISVSKYVSLVIDMVRNSGFEYKLTAMGTIVETSDMQSATNILLKAQQLLEPRAERIYCTATFDIKTGDKGRMTNKILSVESKIGQVNH